MCLPVSSLTLIATQHKYQKIKLINSSKITRCPLMLWTTAEANRPPSVNQQPFIFFLLLPSVPAFIIQPMATTVSNKPLVASWQNDRSRSSILGDEESPQNNRQHISHEETQHCDCLLCRQDGEKTRPSETWTHCAAETQSWIICCSWKHIVFLGTTWCS